jgi:DNA segregation ATPase FtsK/SpoIIIE, S-DNA-T family
VARSAKKVKESAKKKTTRADEPRPRRASREADEVVIDETLDESRLLDEVVAVVVLTGAFFTMLSFVAYQRGSAGLNLAGRVGEVLADALVQALGFAAYLGPVFLVVVAYLLFRQAGREITAVRSLGALVLVLCCAVMVALLLPPDRPVSLSGGWVGGLIAQILRQAFGTPGAFLMVSSLTVLSFLVVTRMSLGRIASATAASAATGVKKAASSLSKPAKEVALQIVPPPAKANVRREEVPRDLEPRSAPVIVRPSRDEPRAVRKARAVQEELPFADDGRYQTPPSHLLDEPPASEVEIDENSLHKSSQILEAKLADFGISAKVVEVRPGPVITTFDVEPAPGVKVNRIVSLADDLAMALRVTGVRILAPVPGKAVVGIEVANPKRETVALRELVEAEVYTRSRSLLTVALGKDTAGQPVIGDLAKMPHLLVAGATGSGKSVCVNTMVMSILHKASPRDVRFVMIDLKMLELSVYEDIPHLLVPVVTDPRISVAVLNNIVELMDDRYRLMKKSGVRNIDGYNKLIGEAQDEGDVLELKEVATDAADEEVVTAAVTPERLPKVVVIIDELADLMMTMGRKVEEPITRLAQKARAAGIHLILATQRPSVDVITGLIKANFPSRIAFQTTARVDSRTILDQIGAERLLGRGDMLYMPPGSAFIQRLHGPLVTEEEIHKVVRYIKRQGKPHYAFDLLESPEEDEESGFEDDLSDVLYDQAVQLVTESRQASISWVQRRLRVGYNRAARMIERMEREGVVAPSDGSRPREVLAPSIGPD